MVSPMTLKPATGLIPQITGSASRALYRLFGAPNKVLKSGQEIRLDFRQTPLAILSGGALIYAQGQENKKMGGDSHRWLKLLTEGGVIYALMTTTAGILPLLTLGTAAYRSGKKDNLLEKTQEAIQVASMVFLGYLGAMTGLNYSMHAIDNGAKELLPHLKKEVLWNEFNPEKNPVLNQLLASNDLERKAIGERLKSIHVSKEKAIKAIEQHLVFLSGGHLKAGSEISYRLAQEYRRKTDTTLGQLFEDLTHPRVKQRLKTQLDHLTRRLAENTPYIGDQFQQKMLSGIKKFSIELGTSHSSPIRGLRLANPVFGAMIGATLLGLPLAKFFNNLLTQSFPALGKTDLKIPTQTLWLPETGKPAYNRSQEFNYLPNIDAYTRPSFSPRGF